MRPARASSAALRDPEERRDHQPEDQDQRERDGHGGVAEVLDVGEAVGVGVHHSATDQHPDDPGQWDHQRQRDLAAGDPATRPPDRPHHDREDRRHHVQDRVGQARPALDRHARGQQHLVDDRRHGDHQQARESQDPEGHGVAQRPREQERHGHGDHHVGPDGEVAQRVDDARHGTGAADRGVAVQSGLDRLPDIAVRGGHDHRHDQSEPGDPCVDGVRRAGARGRLVGGAHGRSMARPQPGGNSCATCVSLSTYAAQSTSGMLVEVAWSPAPPSIPSRRMSA